jgi:Restriction endonuclease
MNWKNYEEAVRNIYETLGKNHGVSIEGFGNKCKIAGKSGVTHQIDVLTSHSDGVHNYLTAIECKYWNKKINKGVVMKLIEIVNDCNFNKGVLISKKGFTPDAKKFAEFSNISLVKLKDHNIIGDSENASKIFINLEITQAKLESINCVVGKESLDTYNLNPPVGLHKDYYVLQPNGIICKIDDLVKEFLNEKTLNQELFRIIEETTDFLTGSFLKSEEHNYSVPISGITCRGFIVKFTKLDFDYIENKVSLIMEDIFARKSYTITSSGKIANFVTSPICLSVGEKAKVEAKFITKKLN